MQDYTTNEYASAKQILVFPDHYVNKAIKLAKDSSSATVVNGTKIVKAGTIYPSNDAKAEGIVFTDQDVTDGDKNCAILIHGYVKTAALPVAPSAEAIKALRGVYFSGSTSYGEKVIRGAYTAVAGDDTANAANIDLSANANLPATVTGFQVQVMRAGVLQTLAKVTFNTTTIS